MGNGAGSGGPWATVDAAPAPAAWSFRVERDRIAIGRLSDALEQRLDGRVPEPVLRALQIALDELLTNVIMHAAQAAGAVEVDVAPESGFVATTIRYVAEEFDPTAWQPAAPLEAIAGARIGGHGIALVRALMDEFSYAYRDGWNVVMVAKRWSGEPVAGSR